MSKRRGLWDRAYAFDESFVTPLEEVPRASFPVRMALAWIAGYRAGYGAGKRIRNKGRK